MYQSVSTIILKTLVATPKIGEEWYNKTTEQFTEVYGRLELVESTNSTCRIYKSIWGLIVVGSRVNPKFQTLGLQNYCNHKRPTDSQF